MIKVQFEFDNWADFMKFTDQLDHKSEITKTPEKNIEPNYGFGIITHDSKPTKKDYAQPLKPAIDLPKLRSESRPGRGHVVTKKKKTCPNCGVLFQPRANRQRYCSDSCKP